MLSFSIQRVQLPPKAEAHALHATSDTRAGLILFSAQLQGTTVCHKQLTQKLWSLVVFSFMLRFRVSKINRASGLTSVTGDLTLDVHL